MEGGQQRDMRVEESVEINRPVEEVFSYVSTVESQPEWATPPIEVRKDTPGPPKEGDTFTSVTKFLGRRFETPYRITSIEPNRQFSYRATGGPVPDQRWTFACEEVSRGTRYTMVLEGEPGGFFRLAEPLIQRAAGRQFRADQETLKDMLEARG
jgi:uncharacterized protein YndB with AHSA1/START domain